MAKIVISDVDVLRNAVRFSTSQRAFVARMIIERSAEATTCEDISYLVIEGLSNFVTASEDLLGWLLVLKKWDPENANTQLFVLLDKVTLHPEDEDTVLKYLSARDTEGFRKLLHIPEPAQLLANGLAASDVDLINRAIPHILEGWLKLALIRKGRDREIVIAFNKIKHMLFAFPEEDEIRLARNQEKNILQGLRIPISIEYASGRARQALECQAVLNSTLALILTANGYPEPTLDWVMDAAANWAGVES